jgi:hypothetical protein
MKFIKNILPTLAVVITLLISFDECFSSLIYSETIQLPLQSDCSDLSQYNHLSILDHFFQKYSNSVSDFESISDFTSLFKEHSISGYYLSSIWQPPKIT